MTTDPNPFRAVVGCGEIVDSGTIDGPGAETPHAPGGDDVALHPGPAESRPEAEGAPVHLVGAGPGEPDLLTLDAVQALGVAREVVADRSLGPLLEALVDEGAIGPLVGPTSPAGFSVTRDHPALGPGPSAITGPVVWWVDDDRSAIVALLAAVGRGPGVVRLYRGDPWFHPAGDAERAALRTAGVGVGVLPGVTEELALTAA
ncbi:MAG: hypothetical protein H0U29_09440, partial [Acidimicrobiia bacterium]|nr:hypothetical protein [Acidimicrobiia bacterium]